MPADVVHTFSANALSENLLLTGNAGNSFFDTLLDLDFPFWAAWVSSARERAVLDLVFGGEVRVKAVCLTLEPRLAFSNLVLGGIEVKLDFESVSFSSILELNKLGLRERCAQG